MPSPENVFAQLAKSGGKAPAEISVVLPYLGIPWFYQGYSRETVVINQT